MDYIAGARKTVDAELKAKGFERIGEEMYQKGERRIRWLSHADKLLGIDGSGRKFISRYPFDHELERMARVQRFTVTLQIEDAEQEGQCKSGS